MNSMSEERSVFKIESNKIIYFDGQNEYIFNAHAEKPRPSLFGMGVSAGGKHWSSRNKEIKIEKHTSVQDVVACDDYIAWYTQEFVPIDEDYRLTKNACIYLGVLKTKEDQLIYKGECYGDLCFYDNELFFNTGNRLAVVNIDSKETTILFKHSGIKKNGLQLHVTQRRIFYIHWTHSDKKLMWYDRHSKQVVNPHIYGGCVYYINDELIVYYSGHTWLYDVKTQKKKRFFTGKDLKNICGVISDAVGFDVSPLPENITDRLKNYDGKRLFFNFWAYIHSDTETIYVGVDFSCLTDGRDLRIDSDLSNHNIITRKVFSK